MPLRTSHLKQAASQATKVRLLSRLASKSKSPVAIIGAGQAGLQLGIGLQRYGIPVSIFSNRTAQEIKEGRILSNQGMFNGALKLERRLNLNHWDGVCPQNKAVSFALAPPGLDKPVINWQGLTSKAYQSIDQRVKIPQWMKDFKEAGGNLIIQDVGLNDLNNIAQNHALTIVAAGKGEISQSFPRNNARSHFDKPQRALACLYVKGTIPAKGLPGVRSNIIPGVGEFFIMPGLTHNGWCEMMLFEGIPDGDFDCWQGIIQPKQQLEKALMLLKKYVPWEAERCQQAYLTDEKATLIGQYTPAVRHPTFTLPCGKSVLGIADTVVLNDPIAGQGANNASKAADLYMRRIINHDSAVFDKDWMQETFELYWKNIGKWATKWSHLMLLQPEEHMKALLGAAMRYPTIANAIADGFDEPSTLFPWISHPVDTYQFIKSIEQEATQQQESKNNNPAITLRS